MIVSPQASKESRFRELDGLRGLAASAVVIGHFTTTFDELNPDLPASTLQFPYGAFGVQLFFMISGFVILMSARGSARPSDFVISRFSRLYPAYWASLVLALAIVFLAPGAGPVLSPIEALLNATMVQRWLLVQSVNDAYWTLAVEMQFYLLMFFLLLVTRNRLSDKLLCWVIGGWLAVCLAISLWAAPDSVGVAPSDVPTLVKMVLNVSLAEYGPLFRFGMLAFISRGRPRMHWLTVPAAVVSVVCAWLLHGTSYGLVVLIVVALFAVVVTMPRVPVLTTRPLQWLGKISYSLYIVHLVLGYALLILLIPVVGRDLATIASVIATLGVSWGCWWLFEDKASRALRSWLLAVRDRGDARRTARRARRTTAIRG